MSKQAPASVAPVMVTALVIAGLAVTALESWFVMVMIGIIHSSAEAVPALGFWASFAFVAVLNIVAAKFGRNGK
ncbi:hypothetical protein ACFWJS_33710 [Streptomyces sp. NPDC127061]|uniref:hypothetical protein n=1 Tax=Streptomyces sp. NPDC127061 TaxID=3347122 RepID=UPI003652ABA2